MQTRFFTFPDADTVLSLAQDAGLTRADEHNQQQLVCFTREYAIDVVGVIQKPTGEMIEMIDGLFTPELAPVPGWHINVRVLSDTPLPESFAEYETFPATPAQDFA